MPLWAARCFAMQSCICAFGDLTGGADGASSAMAGTQAATSVANTPIFSEVFIEQLLKEICCRTSSASFNCGGYRRAPQVIASALLHKRCRVRSRTGRQATKIQVQPASAVAVREAVRSSSSVPCVSFSLLAHHSDTTQALET